MLCMISFIAMNSLDINKTGRSRSPKTARSTNREGKCIIRRIDCIPLPSNWIETEPALLTLIFEFMKRQVSMQNNFYLAIMYLPILTDLPFDVEKSKNCNIYQIYFTIF